MVDMLSVLLKMSHSEHCWFVEIKYMVLVGLWFIVKGIFHKMTWTTIVNCLLDYKTEKMPIMIIV